MSGRTSASMAPESVDEEAAAVARRMIMGFRTTQLVHVAAKLGIADVLGEGPRDASAIAAAVGALPQSVYRLLRALASLGVFAETTDGRFELTPLGDTLRRDRPGSLHQLALLYGDDWVWRAYGETLHSVMTGDPAFDHVYGQTLFEYLQRHPDAAATFDRGMTAYSEQEAAAVLSAYDFSGATTLVDVGGGQGALLAAVLKRHPRARGVLLEQQSVIERARTVIAEGGLADRCALTPGDFFEALPGGGDVYVLKSVLHNWDDGRCVTILKRCRDVLRPGARILVIERLVPEGNEPAEAKLFDINMLVMVGGRERTRAEYASLLEAAGLELARVISTRAPLCILEAVPRAAETG
jgi:ubiquinone/menaquinone biosynthesis C-methylase UbiE